MNKTKIITVANRKGGAGKSTCAAHLSLEAVKRGLKVILIDLDPQKSLEYWWKKREQENPFLADTDPEKLEITLDNIRKHDFDLCIIDTPGNTDLNATGGIKVADLVLIPSKPTAVDLSAIGRTISMVQDLKKSYIFLITQAVARTKLALQAASVLSQFGEVAPCSMGHRISYVNAMNTGGSAAEEDKASAEELNELWSFIRSKLNDKKFTEEKQNAKEKVRFDY